MLWSFEPQGQDGVPNKWDINLPETLPFREIPKHQDSLTE